MTRTSHTLIAASRPTVYRVRGRDAIAAAGRTWVLFLDIVARNVGPQRAQHFSALLLTSVHGITSLESSGHLISDKWRTAAEQLIESVISLLPTKE